MRRRHAVLFAIPTSVAVLWLACAPAGASRSIPIPAPGASASAVAAQAGSILDVSRTGASADSSNASSDASVVRLLEEPVLGLGGSQQGDGQSGGSLVDTQSTLPAQVQVAPWAASATGSGTSTRHSRSSAAAARAAVPNMASAGVLTSDSQATHTDAASNGSAVTDGVQLGIMDAISLFLLHSEVSADGRGSSYLVGLNGIELGTDEQLGATPLCALTAPGVLSLSCLSATGGSSQAASVTDIASQVIGITPALDILSIIDPVSAFTSSATSGTGTTTILPDPIVPQETETSRATEPTAVATGGSTSTLPRTGIAVASLTLIAAMMLLLGSALRRLRLRPMAV